MKLTMNVTMNDLLITLGTIEISGMAEVLRVNNSEIVCDDSLTDLTTQESMAVQNDVEEGVRTTFLYLTLIDGND